MSLENRIEELNTQLEVLTDAIRDLTNAMQLRDQYAKSVPEEIACATDVQEAEVPNEKSSPTTDTSPASSSEFETVTYDDVKAVTIAISKIDKAKAVAGLARFGAKNAKELGEDQWSGYVSYMKRVAAGEVNPGFSHD